MKITKALVLMTLLCAAAFTRVSAQEGDDAMPATAGESAAVAEATRSAVSQPKDQTIYGEVQAVNVSSNSMTVQYYDYDTDEEKSIELSVAADAKIENVSGLAAIKKGDWADITYLAQDARNMAKSIIVEKEEEIPPETAPEGEMKE